VGSGGPVERSRPLALDARGRRGDALPCDRLRMGAGRTHLAAALGHRLPPRLHAPQGAHLSLLPPSPPEGVGAPRLGRRGAPGTRAEEEGVVLSAPRTDSVHPFLDQGGIPRRPVSPREGGARNWRTANRVSFTYGAFVEGPASCHFPGLGMRL